MLIRNLTRQKRRKKLKITKSENYFKNILAFVWNF